MKTEIIILRVSKKEKAKIKKLAKARKESMSKYILKMFQ